MGVIYLQHPDHGIKVATTVDEAKYDRENGWSDWCPKEFKASLPEAVPVVDKIAELEAALAEANERAAKAEAAVKPKSKDKAEPVLDFLKNSDKPQG